MRKITSTLLFVFAGSLLLSACGKGEVDNLDDAPKFIEQTLMDYTLGRYQGMRTSDGWSNGEPFGVTWNAKNVAFDESGMSLSITKDGETYYGGEYATDGDAAFYQYGYFGTYMKPAAVKGTASTFFTYTGESDDQPHDEIDIEFLGQDTTKVQFNYFVDGQGGHEYLYDLGFDASKEFHQYGFCWTKDAIVWYVDLKPVYRVRNTTLPSHKQRIFHNFWKGTPSVDHWMGAFDDANLGCSVAYTKSTYADLDGKGVEIPLVEKEVFDFSEAVAADLTFTGDSAYTVSKKEGVTEISYDAVQGNTYVNVSSALDASAVKDNNMIAVDLENKGTSSISARIDLNESSGEGVKCVNKRALVLGGDDVRTDTTYGGSFFTIGAGESLTAVVIYDGNPTEIMLMLDSMYEETTSTHAGKLLVSNARLALHGEKGGEGIDPAEVDPRPLTMNFKSDDGTYTVAKNEGAFDVTYTGVSFNTYANIASGFVASEMEGVTKLTLKVQNLGQDKVVIRYDVKNDSGSCELGIAADDTCTDLRCDTAYGGVYMTIPAGVTSDVDITLEGTPTYICIFLDSTWAETTGDAHSGHLIFSEFVGQ